MRWSVLFLATLACSNTTKPEVVPTDVAPLPDADTDADTDTDTDTDADADTDADTDTDTDTDPGPILVPDFGLIDVNPSSNTGGTEVSPRDYLQKVSGWYFTHST